MTDDVSSAAFSPDGSRIVTASDDNTARIWDAATGKEIAVLRGHDGSVNSAAFSPDGSRIVTASEDKTARIWDAATGKEIAVLRGHDGAVNSAAFSPDGSRIVTASVDKTARIWDAATAKEIAVLRGHEDGVSSAAFSPDGSRIVTASDDKTARIWDAHLQTMSVKDLFAEVCARLAGLTKLDSRRNAPRWISRRHAGDRRVPMSRDNAEAWPAKFVANTRVKSCDEISEQVGQLRAETNARAIDQGSVTELPNVPRKPA